MYGPIKSRVIDINKINTTQYEIKSFAFFYSLTKVKIDFI